MSGARSRGFVIGLVIVAVLALVSTLKSKQEQERSAAETALEQEENAARERELAARPPEEGIALAIVYDTSGSMKDPVPNGSGGEEPKYVIANRALGSIVSRLEAVAASGTPDRPRKIECGLVTFRGKRAAFAVPFGAFDPAALHGWMERFRTPDGPTPLGEALRVAGREVLRSNLTRKHLLVLSDGQNTETLEPRVALDRLHADAEKLGTSLAAHFVAYDVDAHLFDGVKSLGATVVSAADEKQLGAQLTFILEKKILLEAEELPAPTDADR